MNEIQGALLASLTIILVVSVLLWVLLIIAHWRMFTKAGEKGWKSLIPIYADYTLFKLVWNARSFWYYVALAAIASITTILGSQYIVIDGQLVAVGGGNFILSILSFVASIGLLFYMAMLSAKTAQAYGKGATFAVGLFFLPNIFSLVIGFGSAQYVGPQE